MASRLLGVNEPGPNTRSCRRRLLRLLFLTSLLWSGVLVLAISLNVLPPFEVHGDIDYNYTEDHVTSILEHKATLPSLNQAVPQPPLMRLVYPTVTSRNNTSTKLILRWTLFYGKPWKIPAGSQIFHDLECPVRNCVLSDDRDQVNESDAVLVHIRDIRHPNELPRHRKPNQRWVFYTLESPYHTETNLTLFNNVFNWTSTYTYDSDIPSPYGYFKRYDRAKSPSKRKSNRKTRTASWFVTNCKAQNNRLEYVKELAKYIPVDIFGNCGKSKCNDPEVCSKMLQKSYHFYLAFENSNCRQYITEKFWHTALQNDVIPVVLGLRREDYEHLAPPNSFIHTSDFPNARALARYMKSLERKRKLYDSYMTWKDQGSVVSEINMQPDRSRFWCNLCKALNDPNRPEKTHSNLDRWWSIDKQCHH